MAITAEQQTELVQLVVGMANAAPAADTLAALAAMVEGGSTMAEMADFIADHPAYSGDYGLYPAYLPNAIFATNYLTALLGDEVTEDVLADAIASMTADLNAGTGRGAAVYAAIEALAGDTPPTGMEDAALALANKTTVAEYYATNSDDPENLDSMVGAIADVTSVAGTADAAITAIDDAIAAEQPLATLIANLDAANTAKAAFLTDAGYASDAAIDAALTTAEGDVDVLVGGAAYTGASDVLKAALIADELTADTAALTAANGLLTAAQDDVDDITGLGAAITAFNAAVETKDAADEAAALADVAQTEAEGNYDVLNGNGVGTTVVAGDGTVAGLIVASGSSLALDAGITEATNPGVTELLAAAIANLGAIAAATAADTAVEGALDLVENLDYLGSTHAVALGNVGAAMVAPLIVPAVAAAPTLAEIAAQQAALDAGVAQLNADLDAITFTTDDATTDAIAAALTTAAVTAGFIDAADKTAIDTAFATAGDATLNDQAETDVAIADAKTALNTAGTGNLAEVFSGLVTTYKGLGNGAQTIAAASAPASTALAVETAAVAVIVGNMEDTADAVAAEDELEALVVSYTALNADITAATTAFADAGYSAPVTLDSAIKAATAADDLFTTGGIDSQIISFGGDDSLYVGDLTLNADTTAGDEGDNSQLEVWITGTTDTVITIETSVFGSNAATPETYTITLTGVASADVSYADGFITVG